MNVNGVYGNGNLKSFEKINQHVSKELESTSIESKSTEFIPSITQSEPGFTDQLQNQTEPVQKEVVITEEERLKDNFDRMTEDDYKDLSDEGMTLDEYNLERLERVLTRIKNQRAVKEENLNDQIETNEQKQKEVKEMNRLNGVSKKIVEKLVEADLPVTEANVAKIANAMEMAGAANHISDKAMHYLIKTNLEPTIENIYKASYSGHYSNSYSLSQEAWDGLKSKVEHVLKDAELEINDENISNAKWLLDNQLPLTEQTLWTLKDLKGIENHINIDDVLNKTVTAVANGQKPESASLSFIDSEKAKQAMEAFNSISDEAITLAVKETTNIETINCNVLQEAQRLLEIYKDTGDSAKDSSKQSNNFLEENTKNLQELDIQTIQVRRQLEEIRLKMTVEAGQQLIKKGFHLQTDELSKVVDGLKEIENEYYSNLLKEGNASVSSENIELLKGSLQGISELKGMPSYILGSTLSTREIQTVKGLLDEGNQVKQTLDKANQSYEALMTKPRSDMGDSIKKAFQNVDAILEDLSMETTNANQRAVRILGYNGIDITKENINQVKAYDEQVNVMMKNLHPAVTVELIKEGINPLNIPIQELNQQITQIKNKIGIKDDEKYSKYLYKLDKEKSISEEERKSYIGIYRLINAVEKSDGAALGAVIKADQEITMSNLLTAIRTKQSGGIKTSIDDNFGTLENISFHKDRIHEQINAAFLSTLSNNEASFTQSREGISTDYNGTDDMISEQVNYINQLLSEIKDELSPYKLKTIDDMEGIFNQSIEKLYDNLNQVPNDNEIEREYYKDKLNAYQEMIKDSRDALKYLENYNIPNSINNIQAANDIMNKDKSIYKQLKQFLTEQENIPEIDVDNADLTSINPTDISDRLIQSLNSKESMQTQYETMDTDVSNYLNKIYENSTISSGDIATLKRINNGISFMNKLAKRESYEIPITIGEKITNVNVTFVRNTDMNGKIDIKLSSDVIGDITMSLSVKDQQLKGLILCDNRNSLNFMESSMENIKTAIADTGVEVKQLHCVMEQRGINLKNDTKLVTFYNKNQVNKEESNNKKESNNEKEIDNSNISTEQLYSVAKSILITFKELESQIV